MATAFAIGGVWHLTAMAVPSFAAFAYPADYPIWRHVAFVLINFSFAWLFLLLPPWLVWPYSLLAIQGLHAHGSAAWSLWRREARVDWISVAVVTVELLGLALVAYNWRTRQRRSRAIP
jgi:hypothetical protein